MKQKHIISEAAVKRIIQEEILRVTPVKPGQLMSEHRAQYLAEEMLNEGFFSSIKHALKGTAAGAKVLGDPFVQKVKSVGNAISAAGKQALDAVKATADEVVKAYQEAVVQSFRDDFNKLIQKKSAEMIKMLVNKKKMSEEDAKSTVLLSLPNLVQAALAQAMS